MPSALRKAFESAAHLLDETDRLLAQHRKDVQAKLGEGALAELEAALAELSSSMKAEPFDADRFGAAFTRAS